MKTPLLKGEQDDLGMGSYAHGRSPRAGTARRIDLQLSKALQTIGEFAKSTSRDPTEWKDLAAVRVPAELQAYARFLCNGKTVGDVLQKDAGRTVLQLQFK